MNPTMVSLGSVNARLSGFSIRTYALFAIVFILLGATILTFALIDNTQYSSTRSNILADETRISTLNATTISQGATIASLTATIANLTTIINTLLPAPTQTVFTMTFNGPWTQNVLVPGVTLSSSGSLRVLAVPAVVVDSANGSISVIEFGNFDAFPFPNSPPDDTLTQVGVISILSANANTLCQVEIGDGGGTIFHGAAAGSNRFAADENQIQWQAFTLTWTV